MSAAARFAAAALALLLAACASRESPAPAPAPAEGGPQQISRGFVLTHSAGGVREWDLAAKTGEIFEGGDRIELSELAIEFYDSTGTREGTLTADRGTVRQKSNRMEVRGNVVLRGEEDAVLRTDSLSWSGEEGTVTTEGFVDLERPRERLTGWGLVATPDLTRAEIRRDVRVTGARRGA